MASITPIETSNNVPRGLFGGQTSSLRTRRRDTTLWNAAHPPEASAQPPHNPVAGATPRATVLSVDDNDELRYLVGQILSTMGFNVISCSDADSASRHFRSRLGIDLLVTDLEMPGRSGVELARELSALCSSLPVLVVSGAYLSDDLLGEIHERNWRFLAKPYALPAFFANVHDLLHGDWQKAQAL